MYWPNRGVYYVIDKTESSIVTSFSPKVIRIGTHAISKNSKSTLWDRLKTHKGNSDGGGSHRSSVFRLHVGNALLNKNGIICDSWSLGQSAPKEIRDRERWLEELVSDYIGDLGIAYLNIDDEPSSKSNRAYVEKNSISLLSTANHSLEFPSSHWLGKYSTHPSIINSSLWNVDHIHAEYDLEFINVFEHYADITIGEYKQKGGKR